MVVAAVPLTCVKDNTSLAERDSCWSMNRACKCKPDLTEACCYMAFGSAKREDLRCSGESVRGFWVRSTRTPSCRMSENCRSKSIQIQEIPKSQPEVTMYQTSMPVAAAAKARKAAYHSHTAVVEQRDDCSMVRQQVPGCALAISTGDPAFRLSSSRPQEDNGWTDSVKSREQDAETFKESLEVDCCQGPAGIWKVGQREFSLGVGRGRIAAFEERIF